ncbi:hypothetical protein COY93_01645 [Candidatus Uhrbacteria bacterium CG_4_10_14_0_8_um_filter_58_22]|uniref:Uncharacterized protein n=1 Tax=Candidatus Uhrbacteria bacterium CG_4_10_14_0_8_um_filter_58_22 TaxID=1975029 RepID=A0A2M7QBG5_9BACT|nr:MAG: hypothetical protein COY93_01645 [Candidatus Uhrbacteria bacterium CG_4_10_14_0_8_um_filter_58_22]
MRPCVYRPRWACPRIDDGQQKESHNALLFVARNYSSSSSDPKSSSSSSVSVSVSSSSDPADWQSGQSWS